MIFKKHTIAALVAGSILSTLSVSAVATNGILAYGNGIIAHGMGGAGIANASEAMSAADNPALASRVGSSWSLGASVFNLNSSVDAGNGYVDSSRDLFLIPQGAYLKNVNDQVTLGVTVNSLGGINTDFPSELFGTPTGMDLRGILVSPTAAYNVNDAVSVGAQLLLGYQELKTKGPGQNALPGEGEDSATGSGFKLGAAFNAGERVTIGLTYQSKLEMDEMDKFASTLFQNASKADLSMPAMAGIGISAELTEDIKLVADIVEIEWSDVAIYDELFGWEDQTVYKIGLEKTYSNDVAVRIGYNHGDSQISAQNVSRNLLAPAVTEDHITLGFSKPMGYGTLSGYYGRILNNEINQEGGQGGLPRIKMNQNAIGLSYNVAF